MDLVSLESPHEMNYFINSCEDKFEIFNDVITLIGGIEENSEWFSTGCGRKMKLNESSIEKIDEKGECLSIVKNENRKFGFGRVSCNQKNYAFMCQRMVLKLDHWSDIFGR